MFLFNQLFDKLTNLIDTKEDTDIKITSIFKSLNEYLDLVRSCMNDKENFAFKSFSIQLLCNIMLVFNEDILPTNLKSLKVVLNNEDSVRSCK